MTWLLLSYSHTAIKIYISKIFKKILVRYFLSE